MNGECSPLVRPAAPAVPHNALQNHVMDHTQPGDAVRESVLKYFYVDNYLQSVALEEDAKALVEQLQTLLVQGGFELRQWASNCPVTIRHLPAELRSDSAEKWISQGQNDQQESALGLQWHYQADTLSYKS